MDYIRGPESPPQSFGLRLTAMVGRNQIQRQIGNFGALYTATDSNVQDTYFELAPEQVWSSNPQDKFSQLVVSTSDRLLFRGVQSDNTVVSLTVNKLLVLDTEFRSFSLTNISGLKVRGSMNYVSKTA